MCIQAPLAWHLVTMLSTQWCWCSTTTTCCYNDPAPPLLPLQMTGVDSCSWPYEVNEVRPDASALVYIPSEPGISHDMTLLQLLMDRFLVDVYFAKLRTGKVQKLNFSLNLNPHANNNNSPCILLILLYFTLFTANKKKYSTFTRKNSNT